MSSNIKLPVTTLYWKFHLNYGVPLAV